MATSGKRVQVRVMRAEGLAAVNVVNHLSDPFAKLTHLRGKEHIPVRSEGANQCADRTDICENTLNPRWYQCFSLDDVQPDDSLQVQVIDHNVIIDDIDLGSVYINLSAALARTNALLHSGAPVQSHDVASTFFRDDGGALVSPPRSASAPPTNNAMETRPIRRSSSWHMDNGSSTPQNTTIPDVNAEGLIEADAKLQCMLAEKHPLSKQGHVWVVIVDRDLVSGLSQTAVAQRYTKFVNHRLRQKLKAAQHSNGTFADSKIGKCLSSGIEHLMSTLKHIHPAINASILHPIQIALSEHPTWKVNMLYVDEIFAGTKLQPWNRKHGPAQKIFSGPLSIPLKAALEIQHSYLYGGSFKHVRQSLARTDGHLLCGDDFVGITDGGVRNKKDRMFTYVIMPKNPPEPARLYFAETGAKFFRDMSSKHAMHSHAAKEVVYAGEFHFRKRMHPWEPTIRAVFDNNSGTYAPDAAILPKMKLLLERNFPGLAVEVRDFKDPVLKMYTAGIYRRTSVDAKPSPVEGSEVSVG